MFIALAELAAVVLVASRTLFSQTLIKDWLVCRTTIPNPFLSWCHSFLMAQVVWLVSFKMRISRSPKRSISTRSLQRRNKARYFPSSLSPSLLTFFLPLQLYGDFGPKTELAGKKATKITFDD